MVQRRFICRDGRSCDSGSIPIIASIKVRRSRIRCAQGIRCRGRYTRGVGVRVSYRLLFVVKNLDPVVPCFAAVELVKEFVYATFSDLDRICPRAIRRGVQLDHIPRAGRSWIRPLDQNAAFFGGGSQPGRGWHPGGAERDVSASTGRGVVAQVRIRICGTRVLA